MSNDFLSKRVSGKVSSGKVLAGRVLAKRRVLWRDGGNQIEQLEQRQMMAATAVAFVRGPWLHVRGTAGDDAIAVKTVDGKTTVTINDQSFEFEAEAWKRLRVASYGGNDEIGASGAVGEAGKLSHRFSLGRGDDVLTGTVAADVVLGDRGDDTFHGLTGGKDVFVGGAGSDTVHTTAAGKVRGAEQVNRGEQEDVTPANVPIPGGDQGRDEIRQPDQLPPVIQRAGGLEEWIPVGPRLGGIGNYPGYWGLPGGDGWGESPGVGKQPMVFGLMYPDNLGNQGVRDNLQIAREMVAAKKSGSLAAWIASNGSTVPGGFYAYIDLKVDPNRLSEAVEWFSSLGFMPIDVQRWSDLPPEDRPDEIRFRGMIPVRAAVALLGQSDLVEVRHVELDHPEQPYWNGSTWSGTEVFGVSGLEKLVAAADVDAAIASGTLGEWIAANGSAALWSLNANVQVKVDFAKLGETIEFLSSLGIRVDGAESWMNRPADNRPESFSLGGTVKVTWIEAILGRTDLFEVTLVKAGVEQRASFGGVAVTGARFPVAGEWSIGPVNWTPRAPAPPPLTAEVIATLRQMDAADKDGELAQWLVESGSTVPAGINVYLRVKVDSAKLDAALGLLSSLGLRAGGIENQTSRPAESRPAELVFGGRIPASAAAGVLGRSDLFELAGIQLDYARPSFNAGGHPYISTLPDAILEPVVARPSIAVWEILVPDEVKFDYKEPPVVDPSELPAVTDEVRAIVDEMEAADRGGKLLEWIIANGSTVPAGINVYVSLNVGAEKLEEALRLLWSEGLQAGGYIEKLINFPIEYMPQRINFGGLIPVEAAVEVLGRSDLLEVVGVEIDYAWPDRTVWQHPYISRIPDGVLLAKIPQPAIPLWQTVEP